MNVKNFFQRSQSCAICYLLQILTFFTIVTTVFSRTNYPNAIGYESSSKGKKMVIFDENSPEWANMKKVLRSQKMKKLGFLCVNGTFLLYAKRDYMAETGKEIRLLSGNNACVAPGMARSIQPASAFGDNKKPSIVLFGEKNLKGRGYALSRTNKNIARKISGRIHSIILNGKEPWTAYSKKGSNYCIKPKGTGGICILLDVAETRIGKDSAFYRIQPGCDTAARAKMVDVSNCLSFGSGKLEKIGNLKGSKSKVEGGSGNTTTTDMEGSPIQDCSNNDELLKLLDIRMHHDFTDDFQMLFPKNKKLAWRTELLDSSFDIAIATCPQEAVDSEFLQILRELYIYMAEKVWKQGKTWPTKNTEEVRKMVLLADNCLERLVAGHDITFHVKETVATVLHELETPVYPSESMKKEFSRIQDLSIVMEAVWLIYNHVAATCHIAYEFTTNFWPDFSIMFYDMYLEPMKNHWGQPDKFQKYFRILLGGFDIDRQLQGLSVCVNSLHTLEILPRPENLFELDVQNKSEIA